MTETTTLAPPASDTGHSARTSDADRRAAEKLIFEISRPGRVGYSLPPLDVPDVDPKATLGAEARGALDGMPEVSEVDVVRHFTRLSRLNEVSIDTGLFPLGSCTMKYNPRINEETARTKAIAASHPMASDVEAQGSLRILWLLEDLLKKLTGFARVSLQPVAGAQGELAGVLMMRAAHEKRGKPRKVILIPDSAHGTNPASAAIAGYEVRELPSGADGRMDMSALEREMTEEVAGLMLTVPNTLGVFENHILKIAEIVHAKGGFLYCDGANFNSFVGLAKPADFGVDVMHMNLHKTFSTPHGGGGPGAGATGVSPALEPFIPVPTVELDGGRYVRVWERPDSIGRMHAFHGNFGVLVRALTFILSHGDGIRRIAENAVLNANYIRACLEDLYHLKYTTATLHEVVFSDRKQAESGVRNSDIAKRLMDYGFHPPTMSFPLIVPGALMIEPTESEGKDELDLFVHAMREIAREAEQNPELVRGAPWSTPVRRVDEVGAARNLVLRYRQGS
jgi:glycine dehydrogenase subunit 2